MATLCGSPSRFRKNSLNGLPPGTESAPGSNLKSLASMDAAAPGGGVTEAAAPPPEQAATRTTTAAIAARAMRVRRRDMRDPSSCARSVGRADADHEASAERVRGDDQARGREDDVLEHVLTLERGREQAAEQLAGQEHDRRQDPDQLQREQDEREPQSATGQEQQADRRL